MIQKICPFCRLDSYSAYNDPNWLCPYCGRNIGESRSKESRRRRTAALKEGQVSCSSPKGKGQGSYLRVVSGQDN